MTPGNQHQIGIAVGKLTDQLTAKQLELERRENSQGTSHDVRKMNRLRDEIASLERRIDRGFRLIDRTNKVSQ